MNAKRLVLAAVLAGIAGAAGCSKCCDWCTSKSERQLPPVSSDPLPTTTGVPSVQPPAKTVSPGGTYGGPGF